MEETSSEWRRRPRRGAKRLRTKDGPGEYTRGKKRRHLSPAHSAFTLWAQPFEVSAHQYQSGSVNAC